MNNMHKLQGWSEAGKLRFNKLMPEVEDSRSNPIYQEVEVGGMLEKWRSMDGVKYRNGMGSQSTSGGKKERMPG
jgi:hypothetical protein